MVNHPNVETIDQYTCPNCDGNLIFDPNSQSLRCPYCETLVSLVSEEMVEEYEFERYKQQGLTWDQDVHSFQCEACGPSLVTEAHISSLNCPYCGSSHVVQLNLPIGLRPEGVLPFRIDKQEAFQRFKISSFNYPETIQTMIEKTASHTMVGDLNRYKMSARKPRGLAPWMNRTFNLC